MMSPTLPHPNELESVGLPEDRLRAVVAAIHELDDLRTRYLALRQEAMAALKAQGWSLSQIGEVVGLADRSHVKRIIDRSY